MTQHTQSSLLPFCPSSLPLLQQPLILEALATVGGLMTLLGLLLLGIATLRAGIFPRWVGIVFIVVLPIIPLSFFVPFLSNVGLELPYFALAAAGAVLLSGRGLRQARPMAQVLDAGMVRGCCTSCLA